MSLLRPVNSPLPEGCFCRPGQCAAPRIMGRQMPCRDPQKAQQKAEPAPEPEPEPEPRIHCKVRFQGTEYWLSGDLICPMHHFDAEGTLLVNPFISVSYAYLVGQDIRRHHEKIGTVSDLEFVEVN